EHKERPFFGELVDFITSGPVFAMVWEGDGVISTARDMMGRTNPQEAATGTIRGDFGMTVGKNIIHGSDSAESAEREINLFFDEKEVLAYSKHDSAWIYYLYAKPPFANGGFLENLTCRQALTENALIRRKSFLSAMHRLANFPVCTYTDLRRLYTFLSV